MDDAARIRDYWFGSQPLTAQTFAERAQLWFGKDSETSEDRRARDEEISARFGPLLERAARGELSSWAGSPRRRLSLIVLLDQFSRNIYRGTPRAFTQDAQALELALTGIQAAADAALDCAERLFFYMPLQHAESLEIQEESLAAFRRLIAEAPEELHASLQPSLDSAVVHHDIVKRFGRFPHRNRVVGRASTPEERSFIAANAGFGQ